MSHYRLLVLGVFLITGFPRGGLSAEPPAALELPMKLDVTPFMPARPGPLQIQNANARKRLGDEMECLVEPHRISNVGSPVEGILSEVLVDRGAFVQKGQVVARLHSAVESAIVNLKAAQEEFGKRRVNRNEELFRKELISTNEKDELETQSRIAGLELKQQQEVLAQRTIRSPLSGVVVERFLSPGERVGSDKIMKIAQLDPLNIEVIVPVDLLGQIKPGMTGEIRFLPTLPRTDRATVVVVDRVVDAASGTFGVRLELPNPEYRIPAGIRCRVRLQVR